LPSGRRLLQGLSRMTITKSDSAALSPHSAHPENARKSAALEFGSAWDYAPAPESPDHVRIDPKYGLFIGGRWVTPRSGRFFPTVSPSTEQVLAEVAEANAQDVDDAVKAAREAYDKYWSKMRGADRAKYI